MRWEQKTIPHYVKKIAWLGMLVAVAFVLSYIEAMIPFATGLPGVKLGLAQLVTLFALYCMGAGEVWFTGLVRVSLSALLFGNAMTFLYGGAGTICSLCIMLLLKKCKWFSPVGVSIAGGVAHNIGQIICASLLMETVGLVWYLPVLMVAGTVSGFVIGMVGNTIIQRFQCRPLA